MRCGYNPRAADGAGWSDRLGAAAAPFLWI
jgi:hypothetical protein